MRAMFIHADVFILSVPSLLTYQPRLANTEETKSLIILRIETCSRFDPNHRAGGNLTSNYAEDRSMFLIRF